jgi:hypothetical protein
LLQQRVWLLDEKLGPLPQALGPFLAELAYQTSKARGKRGRPRDGADAATEVLYSGGMNEREIVAALRDLGIEGAGDALDRVRARIKRLKARWEAARQGTNLR